MGKLRRLVIAIFIILVVGLAVVIYALPGVTGMLVETYTAEYGELSIYDDTTGFFLRKEEVYAAENGGDVNRLSEEGDLLRPGTAVIGITGESPVVSNTSDSGGEGEVASDRPTEIKNLLSSRMKKSSDFRIENGGIVSFFVDGYEYTLTPEKSTTIRKTELDEVKQSQVVETGDSVKNGYPVFKIISNGGWELIAYIPKDHIGQYEEGQKVDVTFFEKDESSDTEFPDLSEKDPLFNKVTMNVESVETEGDYGKLIIKSSRFFGGIGQYRVAYCRIVSQDVSGLLIENQSIVEVDGKTGVYVKNKKGKYDFIPVLAYGSNDKVTVIADTYYYDENGEYTKTVDPFDDVLKTPQNREPEE